VGAFSLPLHALAQQAGAQDPNAESGGAAALAEVVVSAQKKQERLLDVPVAVTAVNAETLTSQNLIRMSDFYNRLPGLQYAGGNTGRVSALSLRGITTGGNTSPTVAILMDDVPFGGTTNAGQPPIPDFDPATIDRLEVLRGPQGTLYGASSLGGLIKYVTRQPSTTEFSGRAEISGTAVKGGDNGYSGRGSINIPLIDDRMGMSLSGFYREDPAYLDNIFPTAAGDNVNTKKTKGGRAAFLWKATDHFTVTLSGLVQKIETENSDLALTSGGIRICPACQGANNTATTSFAPLYGDLTTLNVVPSVGQATFQLYTARAELELSDMQLTSISAWGRADNVLMNDVTAVFGGLLIPAYAAPAGSTVAISNADHTHKFSQEIRLSSTGEKFDWMTGVFYTEDKASTDQTLFLADPGGAPLATPYVGTGPATYKEYAGFGDLTYHVNPKVDVQFGVRYAKNNQDAAADFTIAAQAQPFFGPTRVTTSGSDEGAFTWLISPSYHFSPDMMAYVRIATGYRPGGPNVGTPPNIATTYDSDSVLNTEVGFKGNVIPGRLTVDAALFQIDWKDIQLQDTDAVSQLTFLTNGSKARSRGVEAAIRWVPWHQFSLDANAAYTDAVLTQDLPTLAGATGLSGRSGDRLPFSAKFAGSISAQQNFNLSGRMSAFVGASYTYVGDRRSAFKTDSPAATRPRFTLPSYSLVDLRAGFELDEVWQASLYVRNLADRFGVITAQNRNGTNVPTAVLTQPRTYGLTLSRTF
jgi:outer membrane receptor protein involved in Fe transport